MSQDQSRNAGLLSALDGFQFSALPGDNAPELQWISISFHFSVLFAPFVVKVRLVVAEYRTG
jgi:hypothetical protein